ncbi:MAG: hypothetical protein RL425_1122, partial [Pseudomonadota bacterium]
MIALSTAIAWLFQILFVPIDAVAFLGGFVPARLS